MGFLSISTVCEVQLKEAAQKEMYSNSKPGKPLLIFYTPPWHHSAKKNLLMKHREGGLPYTLMIPLTTE